MKELHDTFLSADGETKVAYHIWEPEGEIRAVVQISHGMMEYVGRYAAWAEHLCSRGFAVAGNDHLGHGDTCPDPALRGYFGETEGYRLLVRDLASMTEILKEKYPGKPLLLMGHSMGSFLARLYLSSYAENLAGAILMGTAGPGAPTGLGIFAVNLVSLFRGEMHRSKLITSLAFGSYTKKYPKPCSPKAWITKDEAILKKYETDPGCDFLFTLSAYRDLFSMLSEINCDEWAQTVPTDLPLLLISGGDDPVGGYSKGVRKVASMLAGAGARKLTVKFFPDDRHEVLNETDREDVYAYLDRWMEDVLADRPAAEEAPT